MAQTGSMVRRRHRSTGGVPSDVHVRRDLRRVGAGRARRRPDRRRRTGRAEPRRPRTGRGGSATAHGHAAPAWVRHGGGQGAQPAHPLRPARRAGWPADRPRRRPACPPGPRSWPPASACRPGWPPWPRRRSTAPTSRAPTGRHRPGQRLGVRDGGAGPGRLSGHVEPEDATCMNTIGSAALQASIQQRGRQQRHGRQGHHRRPARGVPGGARQRLHGDHPAGQRRAPADHHRARQVAFVRGARGAPGHLQRQRDRHSRGLARRPRLRPAPATSPAD